MDHLTKNEEFAVQVRRAVVHATQTHGTTGHPEAIVKGINLRLGQCHDYTITGIEVPAEPTWYCPHLYGMHLVYLLKQARAKGASI